MAKLKYFDNDKWCWNDVDWMMNDECWMMLISLKW